MKELARKFGVSYGYAKKIRHQQLQIGQLERPPQLRPESTGLLNAEIKQYLRAGVAKTARHHSGGAEAAVAEGASGRDQPIASMVMAMRAEAWPLIAFTTRIVRSTKVNLQPLQRTPLQRLERRARNPKIPQ